VSITKGRGAPEVQQVYSRAYALCQQVGETPQQFQALWGVFYFALLQAEVPRARDLAEQLLSLAQRWRDPAFELQAHSALGAALWFPGDFVAARGHMEAALRLYDPQQHRGHAVLYSTDPGVGCGVYLGWVLWALGYADQAMQQHHRALALAREVAHSHSLAVSLLWAVMLHQFRLKAQDVREQAELAIALTSEQGFPHILSRVQFLQGWALAAQGQREAGLAQMRQGLVGYQATGAGLYRPYFLGVLAEVCAHAGQLDEGLRLVTEAHEVVQQSGERWYEAELHRLQGELLLIQGTDRGDARAGPIEPSLRAEAEASFQRALDIARRQQAKSFELRAALSLSRLWQRQGKRQEARDLLAPIYHWFTEGFDMADLQEAKALLAELS
jgi:predicted ATPase